MPSLHHYFSRAACRARALLPLFALVLLAACDSLYADIPRIGSELSETFGEPPLVHRKDGNALEIVFPEDVVQGADSAARHELAWDMAREAHALVSDPASVPTVTVIFRSREQRRTGIQPREESYSWPTADIGTGNAGAVVGPRRTPIGAPEMGSMERGWTPEREGSRESRRR